MKQLIYTIILLCGLTVGQVFAQPHQEVTTLTQTDQKRYNAFIHATRCMVCQNQSVAESSSMFAQDMKLWLQEAIAEGQTDYEIKEALIKRFGDSVFYSPPFQANTLLLWGLPLVFVIVGGVVLFRLGRAGRVGKIPPSPPCTKEGADYRVEQKSSQGKRGGSC